VFVLIGVIFLVKLFSIQVLEGSYKNLATVNAIRKVPQPPVRGIIYDRNGKIIVYNNPEFDLMIVLKEVKNFDSMRFCHVFDITKEKLDGYFKNLRTEIRNKKASRIT
jgi:penicillin-binding protein 2